MISSHLTPEPERRLWLIYESVRHAVENAEWKIAAVVALCAAQLTVLGTGHFAAVPLSAAVLLGLVGFSPLKRMPQRLAYLGSAEDRPAPSDCLVTVEDLAKHTHGELIARFDKYLGGGITAMAYHEDITVQIAALARVAAIKRKIFLWVCVLAGLGQFGLAVRQLF
jgi:hypothetical protein